MKYDRSSVMIMIFWVMTTCKTVMVTSGWRNLLPPSSVQNLKLEPAAMFLWNAGNIYKQNLNAFITLPQVHKFNLLKPTGYMMHQQFTFNNCTFSPHCIYVFCIWEQTATCATYSINWLVFITEMKSVYCAIRNGL